MATKRLSSCFICDVEVNDSQIILIDCGRRCFYIDKKSAAKETLDSFKTWFESCYMKGIPQMITIIDYKIEENADGEAIMAINKLFPGTIPAGVH